MTRSRHALGPNIDFILERAPAQLAKQLFEGVGSGDQSVVDLSACGPNPDAQRLRKCLDEQDADALKQLEDVCRQICDLANGKGPTSLETVVGRRLVNIDIETFEEQVDALCKSIWVYLSHPSVFQDAQSFYLARRYREHGKLYSAFETGAKAKVAIGADDVDHDSLCSRVSTLLGLKARTSSTVIELPETTAHPASLMVAIRHGGALSSVQDHRDDGLRQTRYYRPANEAILIYTPSMQKLEVCASAYSVRDVTSKAFAEVVLGQDLKNTPLVARNFNLDRFALSLHLPLPEFDDVEVKRARVTEIETRLGNWKRRLLLQVTIDDDITDLAERFMGTAKSAAARFGYSRVVIVVEYNVAGLDDARTLRLWVNSNNSSNAQNDRDPDLRDLGLRLLEFWGISERQQLLGKGEVRQHFASLLFLYDLSDDEITGGALAAAGIDRDRMISGQILHKKARQDIILIDDEHGVTEAELGTKDLAGQSTQSGPFGEPLGAVDAAEYVVYRMDRGYLAELLAECIQQELGASQAIVQNDDIIDFGSALVGEDPIPVYLVRGLERAGKPAELDLALRQRTGHGGGVVFTAGPTDIKFLGPNVVVPVFQVFDPGEDGLVLRPDALEAAYRSGKSLLWASEVADLTKHSLTHATLMLPGLPPLHLYTHDRVTMFDRLMKAHKDGSVEVQVVDLMKDCKSKSPQQLFRAMEWQSVKDTYIKMGKRRGYWRLGGGEPQAI